MLRPLLAAALLAGSGPAGCTMIRRPAVSVARVAVNEVGGEAVGLGCVLELANPNAIPLRLDEFRYELSIDGETVYEGRRSAEATLGARSTRTITVPAVVPAGSWREAEGGERRPGYELRGTVRYRAPSDLARLLFDLKVRRPKAAFRGEGEIAR